MQDRKCRNESDEEHMKTLIEEDRSNRFRFHFGCYTRRLSMLALVLYKVHARLTELVTISVTSRTA